MNKYHQVIRMRRVFSKVDVWLRLKFCVRDGIKVDKTFFEKYRPTFLGWVWWALSLLAGTKKVSVQCYDFAEKTRECNGNRVGYAILHWAWASTGTIQELLQSVDRVKEDGEILIAHGTRYSVGGGCHGFTLLPCIVGTPQGGRELRTIADFEICSMPENKSKESKLWFLEIPPQ